MAVTETRLWNVTCYGKKGTEENYATVKQDKGIFIYLTAVCCIESMLVLFLS